MKNIGAGIAIAASYAAAGWSRQFLREGQVFNCVSLKRCPSTFLAAATLPARASRAMAGCLLMAEEAIPKSVVIRPT